MTNRFKDLCQPCREAWLSWADYKQPVPFLIHSVGGDRGRVSSYEKWKETIKSQRDVIETICERNHR